MLVGRTSLGLRKVFPVRKWNRSAAEQAFAELHEGMFCILGAELFLMGKLAWVTLKDLVGLFISLPPILQQCSGNEVWLPLMSSLKSY